MRRTCIICVMVLISNSTGLCASAQDLPITVTLKGPQKHLKMGDVPEFVGRVTNSGNYPLKGLVVYLSLVSLKPGHEHPVDLEDWSAQKAVRIGRLAPAQSVTQKWPLRLIQSGRFAAALTVVCPDVKQPVISEMAPFAVRPKPTVVPGRILPIAFGEPLLLLALFGLTFHRKTWLKYLGKVVSHSDNRSRSES